MAGALQPCAELYEAVSGVQMSPVGTPFLLQFQYKQSLKLGVALESVATELLPLLPSELREGRVDWQSSMGATPPNTTRGLPLDEDPATRGQQDPEKPTAPGSLQPDAPCPGSATAAPPQPFGPFFADLDREVADRVRRGVWPESCGGDDCACVTAACPAGGSSDGDTVQSGATESTVQHGTAEDRHDHYLRAAHMFRTKYLSGPAGSAFQKPP